MSKEVCELDREGCRGCSDGVGKVLDKEEDEGPATGQDRLDDIVAAVSEAVLCTKEGVRLVGY